MINEFSLNKGENKDEEKIGILQKIFHWKPETGFLIGSLLEESSKNKINIKGNFLEEVKEQKTIKIKGYWENDPEYGRQFLFRDGICILPTNREGIISYLSSGDFPGIGSKTSERIYEQFGEKTYEVIDTSPNKLLSIKGFGKKQLKSVLKGREIQRETREIRTFLGSIGITETFIQKILTQYGSKCVSLIKENPYILFLEVKGIGFVMADNIANQLGFDKNSPKRAEGALINKLDKESQNGHTCFPKNIFMI